MAYLLIKTKNDARRLEHLIQKRLKESGVLKESTSVRGVFSAIRRGVSDMEKEANGVVSSEEMTEGMLPSKLNILGVTYTIKEVEVVSKEELRKGEINFLKCEIRIDRELPKSAKEQVLMHEILHAIFDLIGLPELVQDENKVQSIATALHHVFTTQTIFS